MNKIIYFVFAFIIIIPVIAKKNYGVAKENGSLNKNAKFWGPGVVRFENSICVGSGNLTGTCYTRWQCKNIDGGVLSGKCHGVGTCCVIQQSCGTTSSLNNTYFVSPSFPQPYTQSGSCTFTIQRCSPDICQVRLDFICLTLSQPDANGNCVNDVLRITGGASPFTPICGDNNGQHVYIGFNGDQDIRITIYTSAAITMNRSWKIRISQIGCSCPTKAPSGCLMYYTAVSGTVKSFNYASTASSEIVTIAGGGTRPGTRQIANTNYGICVEMRPGYCGIRWAQTPGDLYSFTVSGDTTTAVGVGTPDAAVQVCSTDFVVIPNPASIQGAMPPFTSDRFCGNGFPTVVTYSKPFVLTTVTNEDEMDDYANRGFSLMYTQVLCSASMLP